MLVRPVREIKQAGCRPSGMKSRETKACPRLSGTRNNAGGTSSVRYEVAQNVGLSSSIRSKESRKQDFERLVRSRVKGEHVIV